MHSEIHIITTLLNDLNVIKSRVGNWVEENEIMVLNVAGGRESANVGIQERVRVLLGKVLG